MSGRFSVRSTRTVALALCLLSIVIFADSASAARRKVARTKVARTKVARTKVARAKVLPPEVAPSESTRCNPELVVLHGYSARKDLPAICRVFDETKAKFAEVFGTTRADNDFTKGLNLYVGFGRQEYRSIAEGYLSKDDGEGFSVYYENEATDHNNFGQIGYFRDPKEEIENTNLAHEFVHYFDSQYNLAGTGDQGVPLLWWSEGLAQTLGRSMFDGALVDQKRYKFSLSQIMNNQEAGQSDRLQALVYGGGELAVRYFLERQPELLDQMLALTKHDDYEGYGQWLGKIGTSYNADFKSFVAESAAG